MKNQMIKLKTQVQVYLLRFLSRIGIKARPFFYPISPLLKAMGRKGCDELFRVESFYHDLILNESEYQNRVGYYGKLTNAIKSCKSKYTSATAFGWSPGLLDEWVHLFQGQDVLDYGCGYGGSTFFISKIAKTVVGVDSAKACISHCIKQAVEIKSAHVSFQLCSNLLLEFHDNSVDCIYSNDFIEHLHPDDARLHLVEAFRVIRSGGFYLCYTPSRLTGPHDITKAFFPQGFGFSSVCSHLKEYTAAELLDLGVSVGFSVIFPKSQTEILALFQKSL